MGFSTVPRRRFSCRAVDASDPPVAAAVNDGTIVSASHHGPLQLESGRLPRPLQHQQRAATAGPARPSCARLNSRVGRRLRRCVLQWNVAPATAPPPPPTRRRDRGRSCGGGGPADRGRASFPPPPQGLAHHVVHGRANGARGHLDLERPPGGIPGGHATWIVWPPCWTAMICPGWQPGGTCDAITTIPPGGAGRRLRRRRLLRLWRRRLLRLWRDLGRDWRRRRRRCRADGRVYSVSGRSSGEP